MDNTHKAEADKKLADKKAAVEADKKKKDNLGDVGEGILGAALIAKLAARGENSVRKIGSSDVISYINKLKSGKIVSDGILKYATHVFDIGGSAEDDLTIRFNLTEGAFRMLFLDLRHTLEIADVNKIIQSAVLYVNSREVEPKAIEFFMNRTHDDITIEVDGSKKKPGSVKPDIIVDNNKVSFSKVSLKTLSKQFGQVYGGPFSNYLKLLGNGGRVGKEPDISWQPGLCLPIDNDRIKREFEAIKALPRNQETIIKTVKFLFGEAVKLIACQPQRRLIENIITFIDHHVTEHDPMIKLVVLDRVQGGRYKVLEIKQLASELRKVQGIKATMKMDGMWPILLFYVGGSPPETLDRPNCLFGIRPKWSSRDVQVNNVVEKGPLMTTLATVPDE